MHCGFAQWFWLTAVCEKGLKGCNRSDFAFDQQMIGEEKCQRLLTPVFITGANMIWNTWFFVSEQVPSPDFVLLS